MKKLEIKKHLDAISSEVSKAFKLIDPSKQGTAPMLARLMSIERELWSINEILKHD